MFSIGDCSLRLHFLLDVTSSFLTFYLLRIPELRKRKGRRAEIIKQTGEFGRVKLTIQ